jgi:peptidoglycan/LPS O-acetylase OafA/YrhL
MATIDSPLNARVASLDLLRGAAALCVLLVHARSGHFMDYGNLVPESKTLPTLIFFALTRLGTEAVMIFFVLSGFLVGGKLIAQLGRNKFDPTKYAIDRFVRIALPLIPACVLTAIVTWSIRGQLPPAAQTFGNMLGLNGTLVTTLSDNLPLWSIAYEIWFYVLAGALATLLMGRSRVIGAVLLAIAIAAFCKLDPHYITFWVVGALVYQVPATQKARGLAVIGATMTVFGAVLYQLGLASNSIPRVLAVPQIVAESLIAGGVALALPGLRQARIRNAAFRRATAALGNTSYSLYLTHAPVLLMLEQLGTRADRLSAWTLALFVGKLVVCIAIASLFWFMFERHTAHVRNLLQYMTIYRPRLQPPPPST